MVEVRNPILDVPPDERLVATQHPLGAFRIFQSEQYNGMFGLEVPDSQQLRDELHGSSGGPETWVFRQEGSGQPISRNNGIGPHQRSPRIEVVCLVNRGRGDEVGP